jgi:fumarate reductase subunit C
MTALDSKIRLLLYVLIAMVTAASAGVMTVDFTDQKQVIVFSLAVIAAGLNTARSYIDKSPAEVKGGDQ